MVIYLNLYIKSWKYISTCCVKLPAKLGPFLFWINPSFGDLIFFNLKLLLSSKLRKFLFLCFSHWNIEKASSQWDVEQKQRKIFNFFKNKSEYLPKLYVYESFYYALYSLI